MHDFPEFMKRKPNHINADQQNTIDIDGYYFEGKDGSQMAFWTYYSDRESKEQIHEFDEYTICVEGEYIEIFDGVEHVLHAGDEVFVPKGTAHHGRVKAGTRTIHCFGGRRINQ
ncbi:MAG: cupin domain-containing protein [Clostridia bacterium]|nr:cupin domain-containing protein [Clostridia bacterium]